MASFTQTENPINAKQLDDLESILGLKLPQDYRQHLLQHNGGQCSPNGFTFLEKEKQSESCIDWFLAIYDGKYDNLHKYIDIYKIDEKRLPTHIVPIAHDPGGNLICISCGSGDYGAVYFWDHEKEVDYSTADDSNYSNLFLIAPSFTLLIDGLK
jgi:cell wall assembly regulator SMI1